MGAVMERRIEFAPAFDKRHPDPKKNYGIHGVEIRWYLIGPEGVIQFVVFTNWMLARTYSEWLEPIHGLCKDHVNRPMGADVGYHSRIPLYEGHSITQNDCKLLNGPCYYDGSGLRAEEWLTVLIEQGGDAIWALMEQMYIERFSEVVESK